MKIFCPSCNSPHDIGFVRLTALDYKNDPDDQLPLKCCGCVPVMPRTYRLLSTLFSVFLAALTFKLWETPMDEDVLIKAIIFFATMLVIKFVIAPAYLKFGGKLECAN